MSEWRPDGWDATKDGLDAGDGPHWRCGFEQGADAIVAALKEQSTRVDTGVEEGTINLPFHGGSHGFVVFIPDKE